MGVGCGSIRLIPEMSESCALYLPGALIAPNPCDPPFLNRVPLGRCRFFKRHARAGGHPKRAGDFRLFEVGIPAYRRG